MAPRDPIGGSPLNMTALASDLDAKFSALFDGCSFPLTSVAGTNTVTATLAPALDGDGLQDGMRFGITWAATNTGAVTLNINSGGAVSVLDAEGNALSAGDLASGLRSEIEYVASAFRVITPLAGGARFGRYHWTFTASGTLTWPTELPDETPVDIEVWGGGAGGHTDGTTGGGGGGGGYASRRFTLGYLRGLGATMTMTVGAGGAAGVSGSNTSAGAVLTGYRGIVGAATRGGGGGGTNAGGAGFLGGYWGGGNGAQDNAPDMEIPGTPGDLWGGGGGGLSGDGYDAVHGGGGGGGGASGSGGVSKFGGNGGDAGSAGSAPAGGGGRNAAGARGEIRVWI